MRPLLTWDFALIMALIVSGGVLGCATTRSPDARYPGVVEQNPNATVRTYPVSATRVAWALAEVMKQDAILEDVKLMVDPQAKDTRPFSRVEKQALGLTGVNSLHRDANYNITAKSKDGQRVGVLVLLKGDSSSQVSMLYGPVGDEGMSNALLDEVDTVMAGPLKDPGLSQAVATKPKSATKDSSQR